MRLRWNGSFEVYRVFARGVRLRGRLVHGKVSWGQIDKLLPPPSNKPFQLPSFALDVRNATIALATPFGPVGVALEGNGMLTGGFKGHAAVVSPRLVPGRCAANNLRTTVAVAVVARRPQIEGPVTLDRFICPASRLAVITPRFDAKASFNESFTTLDGSGRMAISTHDRRRQRPGGLCRRADLQGTARRRARPGEACRAAVADGHHLRRPHPRSMAATSSEFATAPLPWSAISPPTARRLIPRCSPA